MLANWLQLNKWDPLTSYRPSSDSFLPLWAVNELLVFFVTNNLFIEIYSCCHGCFFLIVSHPVRFWSCPCRYFISVPLWPSLHLQVCFLVLRVMKTLWYRQMRRWAPPCSEAFWIFNKYMRCININSCRHSDGQVNEHRFGRTRVKKKIFLSYMWSLQWRGCFLLQLMSSFAACCYLGLMMWFIISK